jgi:TetR/AcrR family transcriptional regulator, cholesterol catabolism regulator
MPQSGRKRRDKITIGGPRSSNQVTDQDLWREGRAKIIEAALPLFLRYGYHATPVRVIAQAAGMSSGSVFNYFSGKDEILEVILGDSQRHAEQSLDEAQEALASSRESSDPVEAFVRVYRRYAESIDAIRRYTLLAYQEAKSLAPKQRSPLFDREQRIAELLKKSAEGAIRAGVFGKDMLSLKVQSLIMLAHAWAVRHWAWGQYPSVKEYLDDLEKIAVAIMSEGAPRKFAS